MEVEHLFWSGFLAGAVVMLAAGAIVLAAVLSFFARLDSDYKEFGP